MTKYATQRKYQPYIDVVMDDLGLTGKVELEWGFGIWRTMGGDCILYDDATADNKIRTGKVRVSKEAEHEYILKTIMHELKHIQQYLLNKLSNAYVVSYRKRNGTTAWEWRTQWMGTEYKFYSTSKNTKLNNKYMSQPWEAEAYEYQERATTLFPNGELPPQKKLVGTVGKVSFYKIAA